MDGSDWGGDDDDTCIDSWRKCSNKECDQEVYVVYNGWQYKGKCMYCKTEYVDPDPGPCTII